MTSRAPSQHSFFGRPYQFVQKKDVDMKAYEENYVLLQDENSFELI